MLTQLFEMQCSSLSMAAYLQCIACHIMSSNQSTKRLCFPCAVQQHKFESKHQAASESTIQQHLRFVPKLPEHGPKEQRNPDRERKPCSIVCWRPPKGDEELLEANQVLPLETAGVLGDKM